MEEIGNDHSQSFLNKILVRENEKFIPLEAEKIFYVESDGNYIEIKLEDESHLTRGSLSDLEEKLDPNQFFRIHRSYIVNVDCIKYIESIKQGGDFYVNLTNGDKIRMSRRYKDLLEFFSI